MCGNLLVFKKPIVCRDSLYMLFESYCPLSYEISDFQGA